MTPALDAAIRYRDIILILMVKASEEERRMLRMKLITANRAIEVLWGMGDA